MYITDEFFVRKIHSDDVPAIADVQCNSFHEPSPVFDRALKTAFKVCNYTYQNRQRRHFLCAAAVHRCCCGPLLWPVPGCLYCRLCTAVRSGRTLENLDNLENLPVRNAHCRHTCSQAEVLAGLRSKLTSDPATSIILVAVPTDRGEAGEPVAVVEMFLCQDSRIVKAIKEAGLPFQSPSFYGLITSMAVKQEFRRQGCATALLRAVHSALEGFESDWSALTVHSDNHKAIALYEQMGYHNLGRCQALWQRLLGGKERTLMVRPRE